MNRPWVSAACRATSQSQVQQAGQGSTGGVGVVEQGAAEAVAQLVEGADDDGVRPNAAAGRALAQAEPAAGEFTRYDPSR